MMKDLLGGRPSVPFGGPASPAQPLARWPGLTAVERAAWARGAQRLRTRALLHGAAAEREADGDSVHTDQRAPSEDAAGARAPQGPS